jgi:hypothetical protein
MSQMSELLLRTEAKAIVAPSGDTEGVWFTESVVRAFVPLPVVATV